MPLRLSLCAALLLIVPPAWAADGRLEIHQSCVAAGCFPGDTPGGIGSHVTDCVIQGNHKLVLNSGSNAAQQTSGSLVSVGTNLCGTSTSCP